MTSSMIMLILIGGFGNILLPLMLCSSDIIISPALIILMDYDLIIIPSYIIYALGLQWAWQFNIIFQPLNLGFDSYCDHYIISMISILWF